MVDPLKQFAKCLKLKSIAIRSEQGRKAPPVDLAHLSKLYTQMETFAFHLTDVNVSAYVVVDDV